MEVAEGANVNGRILDGSETMKGAFDHLDLKCTLSSCK